MDQATLDSIKSTIATVAGTAGSVLDTIDPQLHVPVILGMAVAQAVPDLVNDVATWISNAKAGKTTDAENAALAAKIGNLLQPEGPDLA